MSRGVALRRDRLTVHAESSLCRAFLVSTETTSVRVSRSTYEQGAPARRRSSGAQGRHHCDAWRERGHFGACARLSRLAYSSSPPGCARIFHRAGVRWRARGAPRQAHTPSQDAPATQWPGPPRVFPEPGKRRAKSRLALNPRRQVAVLDQYRVVRSRTWFSLPHSRYGDPEIERTRLTSRTPKRSFTAQKRSFPARASIWRASRRFWIGVIGGASACPLRFVLSQGRLRIDPGVEI